MAIALSRDDVAAHGILTGSAEITVPAGKTLKIETSPAGEEIFSGTVPAGKQWVGTVSLVFAEKNA